MNGAEPLVAVLVCLIVAVLVAALLVWAIQVMPW